MTRKKVKLEFIENDTARNSSYKKRKKGLLKKVSEISTLCDVKACCIIYSPTEPEPEVWPPSAIEVQRVIARFRNMPQMDQSKKMMNQETFLRTQKMKITDQLKKLLKDNREKEMTEIMFHCLEEGKELDNLSLLDLNDLAWLIDQYKRDIDHCTEKKKKAERNAAATQAGNTRTDPAMHATPLNPEVSHMPDPGYTNVNLTMMANPGYPNVNPTMMANPGYPNNVMANLGYHNVNPISNPGGYPNMNPMPNPGGYPNVANPGYPNVNPVANPGFPGYGGGPYDFHRMQIPPWLSRAFLNSDGAGPSSSNNHGAGPSSSNNQGAGPSSSNNPPPAGHSGANNNYMQM